MDSVAGSVDVRYPMRWSFFGCCATAGKQNAKSMTQRIRPVTFFFMSSPIPPSTRPSTLGTRPFLLDHLVRAHHHVRRNRQANLLGGFQINDELELLRQLNWNVGRFGAFENLIDVGG